MAEILNNNFTPGRPKGLKNKSTLGRADKFRKLVEDSDVIQKMFDRLVTRLENDEIKTSDLNNTFKIILSYYIPTAGAELVSEEINSIETREDAQKVAEEIKNRIVKLKMA